MTLPLVMPTVSVIPREFFTEWVPKIDNFPELKVVNAVVGKTLELGMLTGIKLTLNDFKPLTHLSKPSIVKGINAALEHDYIERFKVGRSFKYRLRIELSSATRENSPAHDDQSDERRVNDLDSYDYDEPECDPNFGLPPSTENSNSPGANIVVKDSTTTTKTSNDVFLQSSGNGLKRQTEQQLLFSLARQLTGIMTPGRDASTLHGKIAKTLAGNHLDPTAISEMWKCVVNVTGEARLTLASATNIAQTVKELLLAVPAYTPQDVRAWASAKLDDGWKPGMITVKSIRENISKAEPIPAAPPPNYVPPDTGPKQTPEERRASYERSKAKYLAEKQAKRDAWLKEHPELLEGQRILEEKRNELLQHK